MFACCTVLLWRTDWGSIVGNHVARRQPGSPVAHAQYIRAALCLDEPGGAEAVSLKAAHGLVTDSTLAGLPSGMDCAELGEP